MPETLIQIVCHAPEIDGPQRGPVDTGSSPARASSQGRRAFPSNQAAPSVGFLFAESKTTWKTDRSDSNPFLKSVRLVGSGIGGISPLCGAAGPALSFLGNRSLERAKPGRLHACPV